MDKQVSREERPKLKEKDYLDELEKLQRKIMKAAVLHLKKISAVQGARNRMSPEDFNLRMAKLKNHRLGVTAAKAANDASSTGPNSERAS